MKFLFVNDILLVANIANNLNNNNNNQNDNNLNYVHQQNNNLNMNQNIVNQLNIDLPPPVPGKRSVQDIRAAQERIKQMLNISSESVFGCREDINKVASKAFLDVLKISVYNGVINDWSLPCLGRILCECRCHNNLIVYHVSVLFLLQ